MVQGILHGFQRDAGELQSKQRNVLKFPGHYVDAGGQQPDLLLFIRQNQPWMMMCEQTDVRQGMVDSSG